MASWRDAILDKFVPHISRLTLVSDPDNLLTEEKLALGLRQRGFDLIEFDDSVAFRYAYESQYRSIWDQGAETSLVVILRISDRELDTLPYDLLQAGRRLSFSLGEIFPNFSYPILDALDRGLLDRLFDAQQSHQPQRLGDKATADFILRYVFSIDIALIADEVSLLRELMRLHYKNAAMPKPLRNRLVEWLSESGRFQEWPIADLVMDQQTFLSFLQERWPVFLNHQEEIQKLGESVASFELTYSGPSLLPLEHEDIRVYIDNLFIEGWLNPIRLRTLPKDVAYWVRSGIVTNEAADTEERINRLMVWAAENLPTVESRYKDWIAYAKTWAKLTALIHNQTQRNPTQSTQRAEYFSVGDKVNDAFTEWLVQNYASLPSLPSTPPAMLHHIPRYLAGQIEDNPDRRVALLVIDGLAMDQWVSLKQVLLANELSLILKEDATFAWVPTITSVSRQAIFAGKMPLYFADSIKTTNKEEKLWQLFWEEQGLAKSDVVYKRGLGDGDVADVLNDVFLPGRTKVMGLVVDKVDKIMHGMALGGDGMHNQIRLWAEQGFLNRLIRYLLDDGFDIWLTADHGNIEGACQGRPLDGGLAESRGQRARIYQSHDLRSKVKAEYAFAHEWGPTGLPDKYFPLVTTGKDAFGIEGDRIVSHGGISLEEVIVPWIQIKQEPTQPSP